LLGCILRLLLLLPGFVVLYWCFLVLNTLSMHLSSPASDSFHQLPTALTSTLLPEFKIG
jgi:hypothetical protein